MMIKVTKQVYDNLKNVSSHLGLSYAGTVAYLLKDFINKNNLKEE